MWSEIKSSYASLSIAFLNDLDTLRSVDAELNQAVRKGDGPSILDWFNYKIGPDGRSLDEYGPIASAARKVVDHQYLVYLHWTQGPNAADNYVRKQAEELYYQGLMGLVQMGVELAIPQTTERVAAGSPELPDTFRIPKSPTKPRPGPAPGGQTRGVASTEPPETQTLSAGGKTVTYETGPGSRGPATTTTTTSGEVHPPQTTTGSSEGLPTPRVAGTSISLREPEMAGAPQQGNVARIGETKKTNLPGGISSSSHAGDSVSSASGKGSTISKTSEPDAPTGTAKRAQPGEVLVPGGKPGEILSHQSGADREATWDQVKYRVGDTIDRRTNIRGLKKGTEDMIDTAKDKERAHMVPPQHGVNDPAGLKSLPNKVNDKDRVFENHIKDIYENRAPGDNVEVTVTARRYSDGSYQKTWTVEMTHPNGDPTTIYQDVGYKIDSAGNVTTVPMINTGK